MGSQRLAIEAKTFDIEVESVVGDFKCVITEAGRRGLLFTILLGWKASSWLQDLFFDMREGKWMTRTLRSCKEVNKIFFAEVGMNSRGEFLDVSVLLHGGRSGKGWFSFGKALEALLPPAHALQVKFKFGAGYTSSRNIAVGSLSFAEVVKGQHAEASRHNHGSSNEALRRRNKTVSDGSLGVVSTLFEDRTTVKGSRDLRENM